MAPKGDHLLVPGPNWATEDHVIKTQTMKGSPFAVEFRDRLEATMSATSRRAVRARCASRARFFELAKTMFFMVKVATIGEFVGFA